MPRAFKVIVLLWSIALKTTPFKSAILGCKVRNLILLLNDIFSERPGASFNYVYDMYSFVHKLVSMH